MRERNEALEAADEVKTRFLANMSYEFRVPLTSISGFAELLEAGVAGVPGEGRRAPGISQLPGLEQRTIIVDGFSKAWRMTGWRLGHAVVPPYLRTTFERLAVNAHSCVPGFIQHAGVAALEAGDQLVREYVEQLRTRRDALVAALNALPGVTCATPQGAFYAFPDFDRDDVQLQQQLLETAGIATLAGSTFGSRGAGHVRLSFAAAPRELDRAVDLLTSHFSLLTS